MKKALMIFPLAIITSLFSLLNIKSNVSSNVAPTKVEAASSGYRVKVKIDITNDADYWYGAYIGVWTKPNHGRDSEHFYKWSPDFHNSISYDDASYTISEIDCGTEFPTSIGFWTAMGYFGQYHWGEANLTVYINGINIASKHATFGGWGYNEEYNWVILDESKYPAPDSKKIKIDYSENVDPDEESTQMVNISAVDQYGVNWTATTSNPISLINKSYPENDTAERLDNYGFRWKLNSTLENNHYSVYSVRFPTASSVYPIVEKDFTVQFAFPLHLTIMVDNKVACKISGYAGDVITIPTDLTTPVGYYIANYKKTGTGTLESDKDRKVFTFTFISGDTTLTAVLKPISYTLRFDQNGENVSRTMFDKTVNYDAKNTYLPTNYYVREGYKFLGWNTKSDGSGISLADKARVPNLSSKMDDVVILYAQWEALNPSVTASLFTEGYFGLIFGGAVALASIAAVTITSIYKSKKRKRVMKG